jgi:multiple RNA-binding domain-containing protein 1
MTTPTGSSRIIVKNIGKTTTESHLRDLFNRKGEVTDVRIQKTKSGKSREFAFIGFRTEQQATDAQRYFNNTFIQTSRITVDIAKSIHDPTLLVSSKSRHTKQKLEKQKILLKKENEMNSKKGKEFDENKEMNKPGNERQERAKAEFLQVMKSRRSGNVWGNDDAHIQIAQEKLQQEYNVKEQEQERSDNEDGDESDHSEDNDFVSKLSASKSSKTSSKLSQKFTHDSDSDSGDDGSGSEDEIVKGKSTSAVSDLDFLRSKVKKNIKEDSDSESDSNSESESEFEEEKEDENEDDKEEEMEVVKNDSDSGVTENGGDIEENVEEDGRLFIRNLPYSVSEDEVTELFSKFGPLSQVCLFTALEISHHPSLFRSISL